MKCPKFLLSAPFAMTALVITPKAALAADWWLVYAEGERPQRTVHYLDVASVKNVRDPSRLAATSFETRLSDADLTDYISVEGVAIYESANSPAKAATQYHVKCRERMVGTTEASRLWRHDQIEQLPGEDWTAIEGSALLSQVHAFACAPDKREANDMLRVTDDYDPMPVTWSALWPDGVEPQWTSARSAEAINADIDAKLAETRELLAKGAALATEGLQKIETGREQTVRDQQELFAQLGQKASPVLHSWMGLPENALVARWGIPHQSFESEGSRFLYYAFGYTTKLVDENGYEIPQETWACHMTFEVREGLVADYRSQGNYCRTAAASLPYGRPREPLRAGGMK
jgi:hypothetical protein